MSENIFKEIYTKVLSLFKQTEEKENAKDVARNRLRVVLMQDRTNLTPELLQRMRKELIELLSKYVEMDKEALELNFDQEGDQMALMLSIPVIRAKDEDEIEKALAEEDESEEETEVDEDVTETDEEETSDSEESEEETDTDEDSESEETEEDSIEDDESETSEDETSTEEENKKDESK